MTVFAGFDTITAEEELPVTDGQSGIPQGNREKNGDIPWVGRLGTLESKGFKCALFS